MIVGALMAGLAIGVAAGLVVGSSAQAGRAPDTGSVPVAPPAGAPAQQAGAPDALVPAYVSVVDNLATAIRRADAKLAAQFREQLSRLRTPTVVAALHSDAARVLADLATARARHDAQAGAGYRQQLGVFCANGPARSGLEFCDWTLP